MIIITFTDFKYLDVFNIFYDNFKKLNLDLLVVSLDLKTFNELTIRGIKTIYKPYNININIKSQFWKFRLNIINEIFKKNKTDIIHTDADCFWFKNILECIENNKTNLDIIGSIGYGSPIEIVKKMGFILCCGFYFIKYTEKNRLIIDKIANQKFINSTDDQTQFNYYIFNNCKKIVENKNNNFIYKTIILNDATRVGIIRQNIISRKYNKDLYCFHPYLLSNNIAEKVLQIKSAF
jgi:hypothetical protein